MIRRWGVPLVVFASWIALVPAARIDAAAAAPAVAPAPAILQAYRAPYLPAADDEVLQEVPSAANPHTVEIRELRSRFDRQPRDLELANRLASAYIDFGRELGDAHYVGYAEAVIAPWLAGASPPASTLVLEATVLQYRHRFAPARDLLKRAIATDPRNPQAWLTLATLDMVQGDYATAATDCRRFAELSGPLPGAICAANLDLYLGQAGRGIKVLQAVRLSARGSSPAYLAWIDGLIAEGAERIGDWPVAEAAYKRALSDLPNDNFLLVAYGDFLLDRGRPAEVVTLLTDYAQSDTAFLRLVLAQAALKGADLPRYNFVMAARFAALAQRGEDLFGREQVRFALHAQRDPATALTLAQQNWQVQRAPWDVRVFLEAAAAAQKPEAALPVLEFVDRTKLEDPVSGPLATQLRAQIAASRAAR